MWKGLAALSVGLIACRPGAPPAASAAPLGPLPPTAPASTVFEGEIEFAIKVLEGPEGIEAALGPPELRRDVLRAAPGKVRTSACAMRAGCGYQIADRSQDRLWIVFDEPQVALEHELSAFVKLAARPLAPRPDIAAPKDPREWSKIEATRKGEVAGVPCDELIQTTGYGGRWEACATRAPEFAELIAHFVEVGVTGHVYVSFRPWVSAGWFPLRIATVLPELKTEVRAVRITRKTMGNGLFVVPPDYKTERIQD